MVDQPNCQMKYVIFVYLLTNLIDFVLFDINLGDQRMSSQFDESPRIWTEHFGSVECCSCC